MPINNKIRLFSLLLAAILLLGGCAREEDSPQSTQNPLKGDLVCLEYSRYTGYVGGKKVSNVAAMLVMNQSDEFLEYATVQCDVGPRRGTFQIEGLPPGRMCWVLEQSLMSMSEGERFVAMACDDFYFNPNAMMTTNQVAVSVQGSTMTVTNQSGITLTNVAIYFKNLHSDGAFFGGDAYMVTFDTLAPGATASKQHAYLGDSSQVVKYSFQES